LHSLISIWPSNPGREEKLFSSPKSPYQIGGTSSLPLNGYRTLSWGKMPGREFGYSPSYKPEVMNEWKYNSTPSISIK
jgi:hypothetical protein